MQIFRPASPVQWAWVSLKGPDAQDFLHRITTVHVRQLGERGAAPGCILSASGKIRALFTLWCLSRNEYGFELDAGQDGHWKRELLALIDHYTFSEKMTLEEGGGGSCLWLFPEKGEPLAELRAGSIAEGARLCAHGDKQFGRPWLSVWGAGADFQGTEIGFAQLEQWRIQAARPGVDREILFDATIPLEVGLTDYVAHNKGCYPGQEVIERISSLGVPARRLVQFAQVERQTGGLKTGMVLVDPESPSLELGSLTSVNEKSGKTEACALGFVRKTYCEAGKILGVQGDPALRLQILQVTPYV